MLFLISIIFTFLNSSNAASYFCEDNFKCDIKVEDYDDEVIERENIKIPYLFQTPYNPKEETVESVTEREKFSILSSAVHNVYVKKYRDINCNVDIKVQEITKWSIDEDFGDDYKDVKGLAITNCTREYFKKKNDVEIRNEKCLKIAQCNSSTQNISEIDRLIRLIKEYCE